MPVQWTAERNQRILYAIMECFDLDNGSIANTYKRKYGDGKDEPTHRAIVEQLKKLKRDGGVASKGQKAVTPKTPTKMKPTTAMTPSKPTSTTKTPKNSAKRKRPTMSKDDMESGSESEQYDTPQSFSRRATTGRSSKAVRRNYQEDVEDDADGELEPEDEVTPKSNKQLIKAVANDASTLSDHEFNVDSTDEARPSSFFGSGLSSIGKGSTTTPKGVRRKAFAKKVIDGESDVSEFDPME